MRPLKTTSDSEKTVVAMRERFCSLWTPSSKRSVAFAESTWRLGSPAGATSSSVSVRTGVLPA